jgi:hypothetical protein
MNTKIINTSMGDIKCREFEDRLEIYGLKYANAGRWDLSHPR